MNLYRNITAVTLISAPLSLISFAQIPPAQDGVGLRKVLKSSQYVAHEWGTFTSLQGSDGIDRPGLHHGDETLPNFVHCPLGFGYSRCLSLVEPSENSALAATQRMETPVIYFYANTPQTVEVSVDFPEGLITEWYPAATSYLPELQNVTELKNGRMTWRTDILTDEPELPVVSTEEIWQAQREVDSNQIRVEGENERFIFYRGIGRFTTDFVVTSSAESLTLANNSPTSVPAILLLNFNGEKGAFRIISGLLPNGQITIPEDQIPDPLEGESSATYVESISLALEDNLVKAGLFPLEAQAMVNTWKRSYFQTPGLRALYILPRQWTDQLVPLQLNPAPINIERVFVGRVEIFRVAEERALLLEVQSAIAEGIEAWNFRSVRLGRFAEPKLWRLRSLATNEIERQYIDELIQATFRP